MKFLHISDIHMRSGWFEEQGVVLSEFLKDVEIHGRDVDYLIVSGDLVQAGEDPNLYDTFEKSILFPLQKIGFEKSKTIVVPGNHDIDGSYVRENISSILGIPLANNNESSVATYLSSKAGKRDVRTRLENYAAFEASSCGLGAMDAGPTGTGYALSEDVGVFCLNSAVFSFGGQKDMAGGKIVDEGKLTFDSRALQKWLQETAFKHRILITHHPIEVLAPWAAAELERIVHKHFRAIFSGHIHQTKWGQQASAAGSSVFLSAPALFTRKSETLGYTLVQLEADGTLTASYRQWVSEAQKFVRGTALSLTDSGSVQFPAGNQITPVDPAEPGGPRVSDRDEIAKRLNRYFEEALRCYPQVPGEWLGPVLATVPQGTSGAETTATIKAAEFALGAANYVIKAPPQFGLTTFGRYIALRRFEAELPGVTLFVDSRELPNHETGVRDFCLQKLASDFGGTVALGAIVVDNWDPFNALRVRQVNSIKENWPDVPLFLLSGVEHAENLSSQLSVSCKANFQEFCLWALDREQIWYLVERYVQRGSQLDVDQAVTRVAEHLEALNLHRTPLNVFVLLLVFEGIVDHSPVNRTELIDSVLHVTLAHLQKIPRYNSIPDTKDTKFALGHFAKKLINEVRLDFTRLELQISITEYCNSKKVDFDIDLLINVLQESGIIVSSAYGRLSFRFSYWVYYFAAFQMHVEPAFYNHMVVGRRYSAYYEVIEFYCGIDRQGDQLIDTIYADLSGLNNEFESRTDLAIHTDYFESLRWEIDAQQIESAKETVKAETERSGLPAPVKHAIADLWYDPAKPYKQEIRVLLDDSSLANCRRVMISAARALRNCDHGDVVKRSLLLSEVMRTWKNIFRVLSLLAPALAEDGQISYEGLGFYLGRTFDPIEDEDKLPVLLSVLPSNISRFYRGDLFSPKTAPLLFDQQKKSGADFEKFALVCTFIHERPRNWEQQVQRAVEAWDRTSFYLWATLKELTFAYRTGFHRAEDAAALRRLVGEVAAKHNQGRKKSTAKTIEAFAKKMLGKGDQAP
jgi:predicted MPP superfamily phosphohydrolase